MDINSYLMLAYQVLESIRDFEEEAISLLCCIRQAPKPCFPYIYLDRDRKISFKGLQGHAVYIEAVYSF